MEIKEQYPVLLATAAAYFFVPLCCRMCWGQNTWFHVVIYGEVSGLGILKALVHEPVDTTFCLLLEKDKNADRSYGTPILAVLVRSLPCLYVSSVGASPSRHHTLLASSCCSRLKP